MKKVIIILLSIFVIVFIGDTIYTFTAKKGPLFVLKTTTNDNSKLKKGLFYTTIECNNKYLVSFLGTKKLTCMSSTNDIKFSDYSNGNDTKEIDYFYEDEDYRYYFTTSKSSKIIVTVDGNEYLLKEALNKKIINITDLDKKIDYYKENKVVANDLNKNKIKLVASDAVCVDKEKIYSYLENDYYYMCSKTKYELEINGTRMSIYDALISGKTTIDELKKLGLNILLVPNSKDIKDDSKPRLIFSTTLDSSLLVASCTVLNDNESINIFYEDSKSKKNTIYQYYYYCFKTGDYLISYLNNNYTIKEALDKKIVTINDLKVLGLKYYIREINKDDTNKPITNIPKLIWKLKDSNSTAQKNECINDPKLGVICIFYNEVLSQKNKIVQYYYFALKSKEPFILFKGNNYTLTYAIKNNIISISDLNNLGLKYYTREIENKVSGGSNSGKIVIDDNKTIKIPKITIIDKSNTNELCAQAIDYFYEDDNYKYYFTCIKSNSIYIKVGNSNVEYSLRNALTEGIVNIRQLELNGLKFFKESKNLKS